MSGLSNKKTIAKNAAFLYVRMFFVMIITLISVRLILRVLGVEDYGIYNAIGGVVTSMSFISSILSNASQRYFSYEMEHQNIEKLKETFSTMMVIYIVISIIIFLILQYGGMWFLHNKMMIPSEKINIAESVLTFSMLTFIVTIMTNPFPALIIAHEEMGVYALLSIMDAILKFSAIIVLFFISENQLVLYSVSLFIVSVIYAITCFSVCRFKYQEVRLKLSVNKKMLISIANFSGWTLFGSLANMGYTQGLNLMLNVFVGPIANAAYAIGNQVSNAINSLGSGFFSAMRPSMIKSIAKNDLQYTNELFNLSNKITFYLMSALSIPLLIYTPIILELWLGSVHEYMIPFTRILIFSIIVQNLGMPLTTLAQGANIVRKYHLCVDGFTLLALPLIYGLLKCGISSVTVLTVYVVIFCIAHIVRLFVTHNVIRFSIKDYLLNFLLPAIVIFGFVILTGYAIQNYVTEPIVSFFFGITIIFVLLSLGTFFILLEKRERKSIINIVKSKI